LETATQAVDTAPNPPSTEIIRGTLVRHKPAAFTVLAIILAGLIIAIYFYSTRRSINSVAVLPFVNDSNDPNAEYFSDGITESIIRRLSQLPNLRVMSRSAVFRFKDKNLDPQEIGATLRSARSLLAGS